MSRLVQIILNKASLKIKKVNKNIPEITEADLEI
jgi:hypothetical protein